MSFSSYEEFWPYYVAQHTRPLCRWLHFIGSSLVLAWGAVSVLTRNPLYLLASPVTGYGFAWIGHFLVEKNHPATFKYPAWSLRADLRMYRYMLLGRMRGEVDRVRREEPEGSRGTR
jgi:hypothetical protein